MNQAAVDLVARTLPAGLPHPGDQDTPPRLIPLPGFRATGMSDEQAQEFIGQSARLVSEAFIALLELEFVIRPKAEDAQLVQAAADAPDGTRVINVCTSPIGEPVLQLTVGKSDDRVIIPANVLKKVGEKL